LTNTQTSEPGGLDQIALGNPSFVWRSGQERRLEMIRRYVDLEGARLLDIGCGLGAYVRAFSRYTDRAFGLDIDAKRVETGVDEGLSRLVTGVSEALPFAEGSFDGILLNEVLEHVRNDRETLREALRVLRPGGRIVIFVPNRFYPFETHGIYMGKKYVVGNIPPLNYLPDPMRNKLVPHARAYTKAGLERVTAGLPCRWVDWTVIFPGYDNIVARQPVLGRSVQKITYGMEQTWFKRLGLSHLLVLERS
jgi:SAM-dependent methyltransferase